MKLNPIQNQQIVKLTKGRELEYFQIKGNHIYYYFNDGTVLQSKELTEDYVYWMRLQLGTEPDFLRAVYNLLLEIIKK